MKNCFTCASGSNTLCHAEEKTFDQDGICCEDGLNNLERYCNPKKSGLHCSDPFSDGEYKYYAHCPGITPEACGGHLYLIPIADK